MNPVRSALKRAIPTLAKTAVAALRGGRVASSSSRWAGAAVARAVRTFSSKSSHVKGYPLFKRIDITDPEALQSVIDKADKADALYQAEIDQQQKELDALSGNEQAVAKALEHLESLTVVSEAEGKANKHYYRVAAHAMGVLPAFVRDTHRRLNYARATMELTKERREEILDYRAKAEELLLALAISGDTQE